MSKKQAKIDADALRAEATKAAAVKSKGQFDKIVKKNKSNVELIEDYFTLPKMCESSITPEHKKWASDIVTELVEKHGIRIPHVFISNKEFVSLTWYGKKEDFWEVYLYPKTKDMEGEGQKFSTVAAMAKILNKTIK